MVNKELCKSYLSVFIYTWDEHSSLEYLMDCLRWRSVNYVHTYLSVQGWVKYVNDEQVKWKCVCSRCGAFLVGLEWLGQRGERWRGDDFVQSR